MKEHQMSEIPAVQILEDVLLVNGKTVTHLDPKRHRQMLSELLFDVDQDLTMQYQELCRLLYMEQDPTADTPKNLYREKEVSQVLSEVVGLLHNLPRETLVRALAEFRERAPR